MFDFPADFHDALMHIHMHQFVYDNAKLMFS